LHTPKNETSINSKSQISCNGPSPIVSNSSQIDTQSCGPTCKNAADKKEHQQRYSLAERPTAAASAAPATPSAMPSYGPSQISQTLSSLSKPAQAIPQPSTNSPRSARPSSILGSNS